MKKWFQVIITAWLFSVLPGAFAALSLELTRGVSSALPIAIIPFANEKQAVVSGDTTVSQVVTNDLNHSGQFLIKTPGLLGQKPTSPGQVDFTYWRKQNVNDIMIGQVNALGGGRYQVSFQLLGLYDKASQDATLINQSFTVSQSGLRVLAHHISNLIYQKLTGIRGIFNTKIAYVLVNHQPTGLGRLPKSIYRLVVADEDGFNPQTLLESSQPIMSPAWSPNGKQLAYVSFANHRAAIYLQDIETGQRRLISQAPGINGAPAFSPNGKQLALVLTKTGSPKVYVLNLQNNQLQQITRGYSIDTEPAWSPDGKNLLFTSNRGGTPQLYQYNFTTAQITRLTFSGNYNARGSYLPNDQGIVMMHRGQGLFTIARQNLSSGQLQQLTQVGNAESPSASPNGKLIIYATQQGGRGVLAMVSTNGRIKLTLPSGRGSVREPAWSPYL